MELEPIASSAIADVASVQAVESQVAVAQQVFFAISCGAISL